MVDVRVLGALTISVDGAVLELPADARARELVAWLALHPGLHSRSRLAGLLRPEVAEEHARKTLRDAVYELRRMLPAAARGALTATRDHVGLADDVRVDVREFRRLVAIGALEEAVRVADGGLLEGLDADWVETARAEHVVDLAGCLAALARRAEAAGDLDGALGWTRRRLALEPLAEATHRDLISLLARTGDRPAALAAYDDYASRLRRELRLAPAAETRALAEEIRRGTPPPSPARVTVVPLPRPLERTARPVGRDTQLRRLEEVWADAASGTLRVAVLAGEPGIGKTTLVGELARRVHARGAVVLYGRCDEEPLLPYQPFVEAVERLLEAMPPKERELRLEQRDGALRRLLPGSGPSTSGHDGATARYLLFEAVRALVEEVAHDRSLLLVLDDPHWGDEGTLALLRHLVRTASHRRLLVVLCIRPAELNPGSAAMLADLRREGPQVDVPLEGLDTAAVDTLLEARIGSHERDLAERLRRRTGGNPLFLDELLRDAEGRPDGTPPTGLQEVVARRSARLGPAAHATLELAAVIGLEFDVSLAAAALAEDPAAVLERLDGAVATQLVVPTGQPDRLAFAHALVAEALLARLPPSRRARLHLAVADALEGRPTPEARRRAAELVRHLRAAGPLAPAGRLVAAELEAARQAENAVAHAEAARHLEAAVERLRATTDGTDVPAILARAGQAHARAGHAERAREVFGELAASARALHDPELLAEAALGLGGLGVVIAAPDPTVTATLEEALGLLGPDRPALRARLRARLAVELYYADPARARTLGAEAVSDARRAGDPGTLAAAFNARRVVLWTPHHTEQRLRVADEMTVVARAAHDDEATLQARNWRIVDLLELGRSGEALAEIDAYERLAGRVGLPHYRWYVPLWRAALALAAGRWDEAVAAREEARTLGAQAQDRNAAMFVRMQGEHALELQGRFADVDREWIARMMDASPAPVGWETWLAAVEANTGLQADAARRVARLAADGCAALPEDANWHVVADLTEAVCVLGDREAAAALHRRLLPHAGLFPVVARGVLLYGTAEHFLGRLAAALGRHDEATERLSRAVAENERVGAGFRALLSRAELGTALTAAGDGTAAARVLTGVVEEARARGTPGVATAAERRLAALRGGAPA